MDNGDGDGDGDGDGASSGRSRIPGVYHAFASKSSKYTLMQGALSQLTVSPRSTSEPQEPDQDECPLALVIPVREEPTTSIPLERYIQLM